MSSQPVEQNLSSQISEEPVQMITREIFPDKEFPNDWHVEAIDRDSGDIFVAVFSGPDAEERAREYASWQESKEHQRMAA